MVKTMRSRISLNFDWYYTIFKDSYINDYKTIDKFTKIDIPHNMVKLNYNYNNKFDQQVIGLYRKIIYIGEEYKGKILRLIFGGVAHKAQIFLNGNYVTSHYGGYDEFVVDISDFVNYGEDNYLSVVVSAKEDENIPPFGRTYEFLACGGIYREVYLEILNKVHIKETYLHLKDLNNKNIALGIYLTNNEGLIRLSLKKDEFVFEKEFEVTDYVNNYTFAFPEVEIWDLDTPSLYEVTFAYFFNNELVDKLTYKTGFRVITVKKNQLFLNAKPIKLIGLNRSQAYPYVGYAMPKSVQEKDAEILKYELDVNIVRTIIPSRHFLDKCDEIGLLVFSELPGWNYLGKEEFKNNLLNTLSTMIKRDYHHPAIIMWSVRIPNSLDSNFYIETNRLAKRLDSSRPTTGARYFIYSKFYEDIYAYNEYLDSKFKFLNSPKIFKNIPFLISEHTGYLYPAKIFDNEKILINHALRHYKMLENTFKSKSLLGTIGNSFTDYNTTNGFGADDNIAYYGVMDMFRLPKYAAVIYKLIKHDKPFMEILSTLKSGEYENKCLPYVYIATNVEQIRLYRDNKLIKTYIPSKKRYLKNHLYKIDDFLGDILIKEENFSKLSSKFFKELLPRIYTNGLNFSLKEKLKIFYILKRHKLTLADLENLFFKYTSMDVTYRFDGIIKGVVAITKVVSTNKKIDYEIIIDKEELEHDDTYDATRITIKKIDQDGNILRYGCDSVKVSVSKTLEILGEETFALHGGMAAFWVRSKEKNTIGEIKIKINEHEFYKTIKIR